MSAQDPAQAEAWWEIKPIPESVGQARRRAVAEARTWCPAGLPDEYADAIRRVVSELVTNAIRHAGKAGPISITLWPTPNGNLAVLVNDSSPIPPQRRDPYDGGKSGHGLTVVTAETVTWNWKPNGIGKTVSATIALPHSKTRPRQTAEALAARVRDAIPRPAVHTIPTRQTVLSLV